MKTLRKVTELGQNEGILCRSEDEANAICQLMHDAGLKWCNGKSYIEQGRMSFMKDFNVYSPHKSTRMSKGYAERSGMTLHPASDFLQPIYEVTREQLLELYNLSAIELQEFIIGIVDLHAWYSSTINFNNHSVLKMHKLSKGGQQSEEWLQKHLPKPKQQKTIEVWVNVYSDNEVYTHRDEMTALEHKGKNNLKVKTIPAKLTYEI